MADDADDFVICGGCHRLVVALVGGLCATCRTPGAWTPLFDDVKVLTDHLPSVDPDELLRRVVTDAAESGFAQYANLLDFVPACKVGEVVALVLALREATA